LGELGLPEDISAIKRELGRNNYQTKNTATEAIIRIELRQSREKAIAALYELQPATIPQRLLAQIFEQSASVSSGTLVAGLSHQSGEVRRITVNLLRTRKELAPEVAERLLMDDSANVRLEAVRALAADGRTFSEAQHRQILVRPGSGGLGLSALNYDITGEECLKQLEHEHLSALKDEELEELTKTQTIYNQSRFGVSGIELAAQAQLMEQSIRGDMMCRGLDLICRKADGADLTRVRRALKSELAGYSPSYLSYLTRFGEWEDIPLIIAAVNRSAGWGISSRLRMTLFDEPNKYREAGRVIFHIGRERFSEIPGISKIEQLLPYIIAQATDIVYRSLSDASIIRMLRAENAAVRKAAALKCVRAFSRSRLATILKAYMSGEQQNYYNVVHWLDFGLSAPMEKVSKAAKKMLSTQWA
jgi:hypothetical protein